MVVRLDAARLRRRTAAMTRAVLLPLVCNGAPPPTQRAGPTSSTTWCRTSPVWPLRLSS
jgi:hypothetical protein